MRKRIVVTQTVDVEMDEAKFTPQFMEEFRASFFRFDTNEDHARHLAQLHARGIVDGFGSQFIEGYGPAAAMGIKCQTINVETEIT